MAIAVGIAIMISSFGFSDLHSANHNASRIVLVSNTTNVHGLVPLHYRSITGSQKTHFSLITTNKPGLTNIATQLDQPSKVTRIAIVIPSITIAAYSNGKFYTFFKKYEAVDAKSNVTSDLRMLNATVTNTKPTSVSSILHALQKLRLADPRAMTTLLDDRSVDAG